MTMRMFYSILKKIFMEFIKINRKNKTECLKLQTKGHVAPNKKSLRDAKILFFMSEQFLIYENGEAIGYILFLKLESKFIRFFWNKIFKDMKADLSEPAVYIMRFMIDENKQSLGYGGKALNLAEKEYLKKGYARILLSTGAKNIRGISFYEKNGYTLTGGEMANESVLSKSMPKEN